jgi:hypothetical protein
LHEGKFAGAVNGDIEVELALGGLNLGDVDMKIADRIGLEFSLPRLVAFNLREAADPMPLQTAMQGRTGQVRDGRLQRIEAIVERQQRMPPELMTIASSSVDSTVDFGRLVPVGRSATEPRLFHLATVF